MGVVFFVQGLISTMFALSNAASRFLSVNATPSRKASGFGVRRHQRELQRILDAQQLLRKALDRVLVRLGDVVLRQPRARCRFRPWL